MWISLGWLGLGLVLLYFGAEWLVKGSSRIALKMGISPLVVGLTVVAFGTSAPELFASVQATLNGKGDLAIGNVVGSNICNIALILGVGALIRAIHIHSQVIRREMPILVVASLVFVGMLWDLKIALWEGIILTVGIVIYVTSSLRQAKKEEHTEEFDELSKEDLNQVHDKSVKSWFSNLGLVLLGLVALAYGANRLVFGGENIARAFGVSEAIIGLTLVAFGTSLPELVTSVVASIRNQGDIITGNAIGSCIFNILAVVGITACIAPISALAISPVDLGIMVALTILIIPFMWSRRRLCRAEGGVLLCIYLAYITYLAV